MFFKKENISSVSHAESDLDLVAKYRNSHDLEHLGYLFTRYTHLIFGVCMKYLRDEELSKDAVMDIFERIAVELKAHNIRQFAPWLYVVARNHCLMQLRKDKTVAEKFDDYGIFKEKSVEFSLGEHPTKDEEISGKLLPALEKLKPEQKICVEQFYMQEKSYKEIAENTGMDLNEVKSHIQNGKRNLKIILLKGESNNATVAKNI